MNKKLNITFWGGVGAVTGANFILEGDKTRIAVDCGLLQGVEGATEENSRNFPYDPKTVDFLFVTHAHMDHIGKIPKLVKDGFDGIIYSTPETKELARVMFDDALKIMSENVSKGFIQTMLYDDSDLSKTFSIWHTIDYHTENRISNEFSVYVMDAGHILGSAMYKFSYIRDSGVTRVVFTGDSGNSPSPLLKYTDKIKDAHYLIMDSVYGDRNHEPKDERDKRFKQIINETIKAGGTLVIPAFSLERTQVILYELNNLVESKQVFSVPVFLDSPLGQKVTEIYKNFTKDFNSFVQSKIKKGDNIFDFPKLRITHSSMESRNIIKTTNPKIIIASSGMSEGGRVLRHEADYLPDPKSTILLMGYQAIGTLGREIKNKPENIMINNEEIPVKARVEMISGYSSHKDMDNLVDMVSDTASTVKKVFVVMGEPATSTFLVQRLREYLEVDALYPEKGRVYEL